VKTRRHHNNKGTRQIKRGKTREQVKAIAKRLGVGRPAPFEVWATMCPGDYTTAGTPHCCIWGDQGAAIEGRADDERVVLVRVEVLEVLD
jgi:hypothetical protein